MCSPCITDDDRIFRYEVSVIFVVFFDEVRDSCDTVPRQESSVSDLEQGD